MSLESEFLEDELELEELSALEKKRGTLDLKDSNGLRLSKNWK